MFPVFCAWVLAPAVIATVSAAHLGSRAANSNDTQPPAPLVVPPSEYWDGDDGSWSSFALSVGTPAQNVRVLVSTNSPATMVVLPLGCTKQAINPLPSDCANSRGELFNQSKSSTWFDQGLFGINENGVGFEANLGYSVDADYGLDTLGLGFVGGPSQPILKNQTVAGFAQGSPLYTGIFGLGTQPVNYTTIGNFSAPSFFTSLWNEKLIPSLSWSYTAGAKYRLKAGQYGQLVFGGYDTSRFSANSASFTLAGDIDRDIVVGIQSITYSGTTQSSLLPTAQYAFIESTDPNIWLPKEACEEFEKAFGISIDNSTGLYLINSTLYSKLQETNPQVTFTLGDSLSGGETVNVVLPFGALALPVQYPFAPNDTYYFPLKTAANESQITLGRAFLQEAYLTVDYERGNFSVSQCVWEDGATSQIESIVSSSYSSGNSSSSPSTSKASTTTKKISSGAIAGIAIGALLVVAAVAGLIYYFLFYRRRHTNPAELPVDLDGLAENIYRGEELPAHGFYQPIKPLNEQAQDPKAPVEDETRYEAPTKEIFQMAGQHERSLSEGTSMIHYRGLPGGASDGQTHELEGSRPAFLEMDDVSSRGRVTPPSASYTPPSSRPLSPSTLGRYPTESSNFF